MKALEIIQGLNEQRKDNISKAFNQTSPDKYFNNLDRKEINKSEAFETIQKAFDEGKISNEEFEKAIKAGHKYIRKEGDRYIYKENEGLKEGKSEEIKDFSLKSNTKKTPMEIYKSTNWYAKNKKQPYGHSEWKMSLMEQVWPKFKSWEDFIQYEEKHKKEMYSDLDKLGNELHI